MDLNTAIGELLAALRTLPSVRDLDSNVGQLAQIRARCAAVATGKTLDEAGDRAAMICRAAVSIQASDAADQERWRWITPYAVVQDVLGAIERKVLRESAVFAPESRPHNPTDWARAWLRLWKQLLGDSAEVDVPLELDGPILLGTPRGEATKQALDVWALERVSENDRGTVTYKRLRVLRGPLSCDVARGMRV